MGDKLRALRLKLFPHTHVWLREDDNPYKRVCTLCGRREFMFWNRLPSFDRPALRWGEVLPFVPPSLFERAWRYLFGGGDV